MKRTLSAIVACGNGYCEVIGYITCEVIGEMSDGRKVWRDIETGEQYFMYREVGKCFFVKS